MIKLKSLHRIEIRLYCVKFPNQIRHNMDTHKQQRNQLKAIALVKSGTISFKTEIITVIDYFPLNKEIMYES